MNPSPPAASIAVSYLRCSSGSLQLISGYEKGRLLILYSHTHTKYKVN
jgi:hypothetical protein